MQLIENKGRRRRLIDTFCKRRAALVSLLALAVLCVVSLSCGSSGSGGGNPPVAPTIATQPANQSVNVNQTATFTVVANGTAPLSYQWQQGTTNISGANSASYTTPAVTQADNGSTFQVVVTNSAGRVTSNPATLTVTSAAVKPTITTQPANQSVNVNQTATFTVVANGTAPLTYQWQQGTTNIPNSNSPSYTTPPTTQAESGSTFQVVVSNSAGTAMSNPATLTVNNPAPGTANVLTYHNDNARTGQNLSETTLTTTNVNSATFGKLGFFPVDGLVDAEPLLVSNLMIAGVSHNVLFVATEHDSIFAFDADSFASASPTVLWQTSLLGSGETSSDPVGGCGQVAPEIGITSTPVIDLSAGPHGTIFAVAMSRNQSTNPTTYIQRLHALDLTTGIERSGSPTTIQATFPGTGENSSGGQVIFDPREYKERSALLLLNGTIYTTWASHCDSTPYTAWVMAYNESNFQQLSVLNITPNGGEGAFWGAGAGPAADSSGNFYVLSGNGTFDGTVNGSGFPIDGDFGNGFLKLSLSGSTLSVSDYFEMHDTTNESNGDVDLGSGGSMVLPDLKDNIGNTWHLAVGAGKDGRIYVVNRDLMGKFNTNNDNQIYQELDGALPGGVWSTSAYFNNAVYYGPVGNPLLAFTISNSNPSAKPMLSTSPSSQSGNSFGYPGATPSISANGASNGIVWAIENGGTGVLYAFDATNLRNELYDSNQAAGGRDQFQTTGNCKFVTPMIANGKVFVPTATGVVVFGLLP